MKKRPPIPLTAHDDDATGPPSGLDRALELAAQPLGQFALKMVPFRGTEFAELAAGLDKQRRERREQRAKELLDGAVDDVGADALGERMRDDEAFEDLVRRAVDVAAGARDRAKRHALRRALVAGARDSARVDEQRIVVEVLADLEVPHVQVLAVLGGLNEISRRPFPSTTSPVALSLEELRGRLPGHAHVLDVILAQLAGVGLIVNTAGTTLGGMQDDRWTAGPSGRLVLDYLNDDGIDEAADS